MNHATDQLRLPAGRTTANGRPRRAIRLAPLRWRRLTLTARLLLVHGAVLTLAMGITLLIADATVSRAQTHATEKDLVEELPEFSQATAQRPAGQDLATFATAYARLHPVPAGTAVIIGILAHQPAVSPSGEALLRSSVVQAWLAKPPPTSTLTDVVAEGTTFRVVASPIIVRGLVGGVLIAAADLSLVGQLTGLALAVIAAEAGAALAIALLGTYLVLRRTRKVIADITGTALSVTRDDLSARINYRGPRDEIGQLAFSFDTMLARVDGAFESQRQLLSNVSHQLRTPLTVMRGHLDVLRRGRFGDPTETAETVALVIDEIDHTTVLVDQLLLLGRASEPDFVDYERVDLRSFLADVFAAAQALALRHWIFVPPPDAIVHLDRNKVRGALLNLVDNAVHATDDDDTITLSATCDTELVFSIADTGTGIAVERQEAVFERLVRGSRQSQGSGLGLTLVRAIAEAHGGSATLESAPGRGCTVRMILPARCIDPAVPSEPGMAAS